MREKTSAIRPTSFDLRLPAAKGIAVAVLLVAVGTLLLPAQPSTESPDSVVLPPEIQALLEQAQQEMTVGDPYWQETVERALEQFRNGNTDQRRSSIMLLGKYPVPPARAAMTEALSDKDASVRRAALVSLLETQMPIASQTGGQMLRLLADPEVSVRRIASSSVAMIVQQFPLSMNPTDLQPTRSFPEGIRQILQNAFRDDDVTVRRNMVGHFPYLQLELPPETLVALLHDPDDEVAIHAVRWALPRLGEKLLAQESAKLIERENPLFRLEVAKGLQNSASPAARQILKKLEKDPDPAVAIEAMLAHFQRQPTSELYKDLLDRFHQNPGRNDASQRIIFSAQLLGQAGEPFLREWLQSENPAYRQYAAQAYLNGYGREADPDFLLTLLDDASPVIRQQILQTFLRNPRTLTSEHRHQIATSRYPDVRRFAAQMAATLPAKEAENLLMELLLDESTEVRVTALQQIANRRIPGWEEILVLSLHEENPQINNTSLLWLTRQPTPEIVRLLTEFAENNPNSSVRPRIDQFLQQFQNRKPAPK